MQARWIALVLVGTFACFCADGVRLPARPKSANINRCVSMHEDRLRPFASCSAVGYNDTFRLPERFTKADTDRLLHYFARALSDYENCSQNAVADAMACSTFVPKCVTSSPDPVLPCRRVCSEFLKQCGGKLHPLFYDWTLGMCEILPNKTASSGECLEPTDFKVNTSVTDPLERGCQPLIIPACQGKGYNHTVLHVETQKELYHLFYGSNYTKENASKDFSPITEVTFHRNETKCRANIEKLLCATFFPPCFPHEGPAYYTLCQSGCQEIYEDCPNLEDIFVAGMCHPSLLAEGNTLHGYCKSKKWPGPSDWFFPLRKRPTPTEGPATKGGPSAGVIAAAVIVPVILVGAFIGVAFSWKKRQLWPGVRYRKQEDDMVQLHT